MPYRLTIDNDVRLEVPRAASEQLKKAIREVEDPELEIHEKIHQVRKRLKKIRAVLRLIRPALGKQYAPMNRYYRALGRRLAGLRDAEAKTAAVDALAENAPERYSKALGALQQRLAAERDKAVEQAGDMSGQLAVIGRRLKQARKKVAAWDFDARGFDLLGGLRNTYARGRKAFRRAYKTGTAEDFHELRKQVKDHWYHVRLLGEAWEKPMLARGEELDKLADLLGDDHDLAVIEQTLGEGAKRDGKNERKILKLLNRRSAQLRMAARPLAERVFAEKPKRLESRLRDYWESHQPVG